ncbi:MAG: ligase, partial [Pirellulaceae bacterium]
MLPIIIAADFGGILRWSQLLVGMAVTAITVLSLLAYWDQENKGQLRQHVLMLPLVAWLLFAFFQTVPLPAMAVKWLSSGSYQAYTQWLSPIIPADQLPSRFSISVSPHDSRHAVAMLAVVIGVVFASAMVFCTRKRITLLLSVLSIGVALHVGYAVLRLAFPATDLYDTAQDASAASFGTFINRNNAALFMNLGLGCSLGLMSWRLSALTGQELDDEQFEFNDLVSLIGDRDSMIGIVCA